MLVNKRKENPIPIYIDKALYTVKFINNYIIDSHNHVDFALKGRKFDIKEQYAYRWPQINKSQVIITSTRNQFVAMFN